MACSMLSLLKGSGAAPAGGSAMAQVGKGPVCVGISVCAVLSTWGCLHTSSRSLHPSTQDAAVVRGGCITSLVLKVKRRS